MAGAAVVVVVSASLGHPRRPPLKTRIRFSERFKYLLGFIFMVAGAAVVVVVSPLLEQPRRPPGSGNNNTW